MSVISNNQLAGASGQGGSSPPASYQISRSIRFNAGDSPILARTPSTSSNRKTWTFSFWVKRAALGVKQMIFGTEGGNDSVYTENYFHTDDTLHLRYGYNSSSIGEVRTTQVFRDVSAWMHIVIAFDVTQSTASNRLKLYVNGSEVTTFSTDTRSNLTNTVWGVNDNRLHRIGCAPNGSGSDFLSAYLAEVHFVDGQQLAASDFGELDTNNLWQAKQFSGSYGTNGYNLTFSDNSSASALGTDSSGNSNNWSITNLSVAAGANNDSLIDTPDNYTAGSGNNGGNYCTLNPLDQTSGTYSQGNLQVATTSGNKHYPATFGVTSGKWYWEVTPTSGSTVGMIGISLTDKDRSANLNGAGAMSYYGPSGNKQGGNTSGVDTSYGATYTYNDVIGVALDLDSGTKTLTFYKNGVSQGVAFNPDPTLGSWHPAVSSGSSSNTTTFVANFGQRPFSISSVPTGYKSLCTANLPTPAIADGSTVFDVALWNGTGSSQTISLGFNPDLIWTKTRSAAVDHKLVDAYRGFSKFLEPNQARAEFTDSNGVTGSSATGFTVGTSNDFNNSGVSYVGWVWDAGSSNASNTSGAIQSNVRANTSAGFSIVSYTGNGTNGATVGHGLSGVENGMIIVKNRSSSLGPWWVVFHHSLPSGKVLALNSTQGEFDESYLTRGIIESVTSSTYSCTAGPSGNETANGNLDTHIAYCFAPVEGFSAFGKYTGNGNANGPFVYTGFKPRYLLMKRSDTTAWWQIYDTARTPNNVSNKFLGVNASDSEYTTSSSDLFDLLSNGFKVRASNNAVNANNGTFIYAAFAEHPMSGNGGLAR